MEETKLILSKVEKGAKERGILSRIFSGIIVFIILMLCLFVFITGCVAIIKVCIDFWSKYIFGGIIWNIY